MTRAQSVSDYIEWGPNTATNTAKAYSNIIGATPAFQSEYNTSSLTDDGVVSYTLNLTNSFLTTGYNDDGQGNRDIVSTTARGAWFAALRTTNTTPVSKLAGSVSVATCTQNGSAIDATDVGFTMIGDLT